MARRAKGRARRARNARCRKCKAALARRLAPHYLPIGTLAWIFGRGPGAYSNPFEKIGSTRSPGSAQVTVTDTTAVDPPLSVYENVSGVAEQKPASGA